MGRYMKKFLTLFSFFCAFNGFIGVANADITVPMRTLLSGDRHNVIIKEETSYEDLVQFAEDNFDLKGRKVKHFALSSKISNEPIKVTQENWSGDMGGIREELLKEKSHSDDQLTIILEQKSPTRQN
jgi:hypothetical protein